LVLFVAIPSILVSAYFLLAASPQYATEVKLVVRRADPGSSDRMDSLVSLLGNSLSYTSSTQNSYIVTHYIKSRTLIDDLSGIIDVREIFRRPEADFWARLGENGSPEKVTAYWNDMVKAYVDAPSGIVTVEIRAFRPDDALALAKAVVMLSERLVNRISEQSRRDTMRYAEEDVRKSDQAVRSTLQELQDLRNEEGMLDPMRTADEKSKLVMQLMSEQARLESDEFIATRTLAPNAPTAQQIRVRLDILRAQLDQLRKSVANNNGTPRTVAAALSKFEALEVQRQLNEKLLSLAEESLERARIKAERQSLYLMVFVPPELPTKAEYPRRIVNSFLFSVGSMLLWTIIALTVAAIRDHRN
jgi:capsular polysaccharide transport system permease protein